MYTAILMVHIAAAFLLVGRSLAVPTIAGGIERAESPAALRLLLSLLHQVSRFNPIAALVLLASGLYLGTAGFWRTGWFWVAVTLWVVNAAVVNAVVKPHLTQFKDAPWGAETEALLQARGWKGGIYTMLANDLATLFLMFATPSLPVAVAVALLSNAAAIGVLWIRPAAPRQFLPPFRSIDP